MDKQEPDADHLYGELRRMAGSLMRRERMGHTLQPTALANEAFLSVGAGASSKWESTGHYLGAAANAMRRILIQYARSRLAQKRGGPSQRVALEETQIPAPDPVRHSEPVHCALEALTAHEPSLGHLVELRYFAGYTLEEIASLSGRSLTSVKRDWNYAREWLFEYMTR